MTRRNFTSSDQIMSTEHSSPVTNTALETHRITIEGNCIVDDHDRRTIAKFELYNGSREELEAMADRANRSAQCARADIAKVIAYNLENGSAHGARVVTTPHLDNYHVTGHVNLLALADAVLALSSTERSPTENIGE